MHTRTSFADSSAAGAIPGTGSPSEGAALARSKDELWQDFRNLVNAGDALLRSTTNLSGEALAQAREQFRERLGAARIRLGEASRMALDKGRHAAAATDDYVRANPWPAVGVALVAGVIVGVLVARR